MTKAGLVRLDMAFRGWAEAKDGVLRDARGTSGLRGAKRQRLRRGARQRLLNTNPGLLAGEDGGAREAPARPLHPQATIWQYSEDIRDKEAIGLDTWNIDQLLDRPGNAEIQLALFNSTTAASRSTQMAGLLPRLNCLIRAPPSITHRVKIERIRIQQPEREEYQ